MNTKSFKELRFTPKLSAHAGSPVHQSSGLTIHRSSMKKREKKNKNRKAKC